MHRLLLLTSVLAATFCGTAAADDKALAARAKKVLEQHCRRCHGGDGSVEGGVNYVLDRARLVSRGKVVPKQPTRSTLYQRVSRGEMPPEGEKRPSKEDVETLEKWITAGAPDFEAPPKRDLITAAAMLEAMAADVEKFSARDRRFTRYFSFTHLYNAGASEDELETCRQGLSKLINSLSWNRSITPPVAIDKAKTIYRIDLRHYRWTEASWNALVAAYPYGVRHDVEAGRRLAEVTRTSAPALRGDWFVATASQPPLYHDLLELPATDKALEASLRIDVPTNLRAGVAPRAGFNGSGVSRNNRLIERHESLFGVYWKSYDFASNTGRQNLFTTPQGPGNERDRFAHDGGEIIFSLPNGLFAYLLVDGNGRRIDQGPLDVVSDPRRPDRAVVNGLSCMSCHAGGIISKQDQIRPYVEKNRKFMAPADVKAILDAYPPADKLLALMKSDADEFLAAVKKTGVRPGRTEPIVALAMHFELPLDAERVAAEFHLSKDDFSKRLKASASASRALAGLAADGGTVSRGAFEAAQPLLVEELKVGKPLRTATKAAARKGVSQAWLAPAERWWSSDPDSVWGPARKVKEVKLRVDIAAWGRDDHRHYVFKGLSTLHVNAVAVAPTGRRYAAEAVPNVVSYFPTYDTSRAVHCEGHEGAIYSLDVSRDGHLLASGSFDQTARLWDAHTGKQLFRLTPHPGPVYAVRFSPDGKWLATGSDRIRIWNVKTGELARTFPAEPGTITSLAYDRDGKSLLVAGKGVRLRAADTGKELAALEKHKGTVYAAIFSPDGKRVATGGEDRTVVVWDAASHKALDTFEGHTLPVTALVYNRAGTALVSGSGGIRGAGTDDEVAEKPGEVRVWDVTTKKEIGRFSRHERGVSALALTPDGRKVLSVGFDQCIREWTLVNPNPDPFDAHEGNIFAFARSADGKFLLTGGQDKTVRWWDAETGKLLHVLTGHTHVLKGVIVSKDNKFAFSAGDSTVRQWDLSKGKEVKRWDVPPYGARRLALTPDGRTLILGAYNNLTRIIDLQTNKHRDIRVSGDRAMALTPDGKTLACSTAKDILFFDVATSKQTKSYLGTTAFEMVFAPDGKHLAVTNEKKLLLLDEEGRTAKSFEGHTQQVLCIAFNADGSRMLTSSGKYSYGKQVKGEDEPRIIAEDAGYRLWDVATGKELFARDGFSSPVPFVAFTRDEKQAWVVSTRDYADRIERRPLAAEDKK